MSHLWPFLSTRNTFTHHQHIGLNRYHRSHKDILAFKDQARAKTPVLTNNMKNPVEIVLYQKSKTYNFIDLSKAYRLPGLDSEHNP